MKALTIIAWIIDALIAFYFLQVLAGNSSDWSGAATLVPLILLLVVAIAASAFLTRRNPTRRTRLVALIIAGAVPLLGALLFLGVALIAAVAMLTGGRWN